MWALIIFTIWANGQSHVDTKERFLAKEDCMAAVTAMSKGVAHRQVDTSIEYVCKPIPADTQKKWNLWGN